MKWGDINNNWNLVLRMATASLREFLESSTIHGLVHISTAKSRLAKALWLAIVVACFSFAIHMIIDSYKEWQESPVSTTITTHPITDLQFPTVTVCPPRGSDTALNHLLEKVKDVKFTDKERQKLLDISREVFVEVPNKKYANEMAKLFSVENIRSILYGQDDMPEIDEENKITLKTSELQGSFWSPLGWDRKASPLHYMLDFPDNIREIIGNGTLVIAVQAKGNWSVMMQENRLQLYRHELSMHDAEEFCVSQGGHLPSILSKEEQNHTLYAAWYENVWLGGTINKSASQTEWVKKPISQEKDDEVFSLAKGLAGEEGWKWLDGREWGYQNWDWEFKESNCTECECILFDVDGYWSETVCTLQNFSVEIFFICSSTPLMMSGNHSFTLKKDSLTLLSPTFHIWPGQTEDDEISISWKINDGNLSKEDSREFITKELQGSVSTPGLGSSAPSDYYNEGHEYTVVTELPYNITSIIGDGAMVVDIDVTVPDNQLTRGVELRTTELMLEYNSMELDWFDAESYCVAKGGHLASMSSNDQWQRLPTFLDENGIQLTNLWFGGKYEKTYREGYWSWSDEREWTAEAYWEPTDKGPDENCLHAYVYKLGISSSDWFAGHCDRRLSSVCMLPNTMNIQSDTRLVFTSENISVPALQFTWESKPGIHSGIDAGHIQPPHPDAIGGFMLKWHLKEQGLSQVDSTIKSNTLWKPKKKQFPDRTNQNLLLMMNLVRESRLNRVNEQDVWKTLLKFRWSEEIITDYVCLSEDVEHRVITKTSQELNLVCGFNAWVPDEDLLLGMRLYSVVHDCPRHLEEAVKLSLFFESLLTKHSLNTVVAAIMHNIQPRAGHNIEDFTAVNMWYKRLDKRYDFSLGSSILGLMTTEKLKQLKTLDPPYLENYKESIQELQYESVSSLFGMRNKDLLHCSILSPVNLSLNLNIPISGEDPSEVSHPPHLTSTWSSALIPFCAYRTNLGFAGNFSNLPGITFPLCSSFLPTILEGQLCYKLELNKPSGQGKGNALMLLLDSNEDRSLQAIGNDKEVAESPNETINLDVAVESIQGVSAKIYINMLSPYINFGGGVFKMTVVKRMSAKEDFLMMPLKSKNCEVEAYQDCQTRNLLDECNCVPWEVPSYQVGKQYHCWIYF